MSNKYLKYAIGEIVLVMIGILLALQINNWNSQRIAKQELLTIEQHLLADMTNDIDELRINLNFWMSKKPIVDKVINDERTIEMLDDGLSRVISTISHTNPNQTSILQLKSLNTNDELLMNIIEIYDEMERFRIIPFEKRFEDLADDFVEHIQNNYDWFAEWLSKNINKDNSSKELQDYFVTSTDYRNQVLRRNQVIYNNLVIQLEYCINQLTQLRAQLIYRINEAYEPIESSKLPQFAGMYELFEFNCPNLDDGSVQKGLKIKFEVLGELLYTYNLPDSILKFDVLHVSQDQFRVNLDQFSNIYSFERAEGTNSITGLKATVEVNGEPIDCTGLFKKID